MTPAESTIVEALNAVNENLAAIRISLDSLNHQLASVIKPMSKRKQRNAVRVTGEVIGYTA